jgi:hypothetical protein
MLLDKKITIKELYFFRTVLNNSVQEIKLNFDFQVQG